jgi:hypothetical protein
MPQARNAGSDASQVAHSAGIWLPGGGSQVGSGVSQVQAAFVTSLAGVYGRHGDRALGLDRPPGEKGFGIGFHG